MQIFYRSSFVRQLNKLPKGLQEEVLQKIKEFENPKHHAQLRVHKLQGKLEGLLSFSVNYRFRIVFEWQSKDKSSAALLAVGDHDVYR